jgi:hypothetical protein
MRSSNSRRATSLTVTDRAYIIDDGRIFRAGSPEALARDPEVKRVYLGESYSPWRLGRGAAAFGQSKPEPLILKDIDGGLGELRLCKIGQDRAFLCMRCIPRGLGFGFAL